MMLTVDTEGLEFCSKIFDDVRAMSKDGPGVTRQGYGPVETKTLDYLTAIGRDLGLEIKKDPAGNIWMTLPEKTERSLPLFRAATPTASPRAATTTVLPASPQRFTRRAP